MKKIYKILGFIVILMSVLFINIGKVFADENDDSDETGIIKLSCEYPKDIEPQEGDAFTLYYKSNGSSETKELSVNGYEYHEHFQEFELPEGDIKVVGIVYTGSNKAIADDTYAAPVDIAVRTEEPYARLSIIIGTDNVNKSLGGNSKLILKDETLETKDGYEVFVNTNEEATTQQALIRDDITEEATQSKASNTEDSYFPEEDEYMDDLYGVEEQITEEGEIPEVEHYNTEEETTEEVYKKPEKNNTSWGLIIFLVALIGLVIVFKVKINKNNEV